MLGLVEPWALNLVGGLFALAGTAILFLDLRGDQFSSKATDVQIYIGKLDKQLDELRELPKDRGFTTPDGIDIGEAFEIMEKATEGANKRNRDTHIQLLEKMKAHEAKHRAAQKAAITLVLVGGLFQILAALAGS